MQKSEEKRRLGAARRFARFASLSPSRKLWNHGERSPAALSLARRSAGRQGIRLHSHRAAGLALLAAPLEYPGTPTSRPVSDLPDRARRRGDDLRGLDP